MSFSLERGPPARCGRDGRAPRNYHSLMTTDARLSEYLFAAIEAARLGAAELERWRAKFSVRNKARADLVTDADHASQQVVKDTLLVRFPDHLFIGEEDSVGKSPEDVRPPT